MSVHQPILMPVPGLRRYRLMEDWVFELDGKIYTIQAGFTYDGASVPRGGWYITYSPFNPRVMAAALEHDYFCRKRSSAVPSTRAAEFFHKRLLENHANPTKAKLMYLAVRKFGPQWE